MCPPGCPAQPTTSAGWAPVRSGIRALAVQWRSRRDGGEVVIGVSDDGTGIAADDVPDIVDRFYRCRSRTVAGRAAEVVLEAAREAVALS